ncbi:MAG: hypothetical protein GC203_01350 [Phenylobacterium sp.]|uniref:hypothetical protein n=1 Tax=Phenylobacterium sp. TaxID=1871053 RepID=UPI0025EE54C1|nr:hypothetical protein [Phenylobacterium sp.]MBI1196490.1 hypothetical protein [Phenylobacterium sp.]
MKLTLLLIGLAGVILYGAVLALTFASPIHVERAARGFIQSQIERQIGSELRAIRAEARQPRAGRFAEALAERHSEEIAALQARLAADASGRIADVVARMQDLDCACRERLRQGLDAAVGLRISALERAEPQLRRIIEGKYGEITAGLLRDLRIFASANLLAFLLLVALSLLKPDRLRQLFVPGLLLAAAAVVASGLYLFGQNWFFTLLYADYVGWTYGVWLLLIFGLLADIALFRARVTTRVVDSVLYALGQSAVPC